MRQPMEERKVTISRAKTTVEFPASFMLIASMNPCPCGFPLLDRIDLHVEVHQLPFPRYLLK